MKKMTKQEMRELILMTMHEYIRTEVDDENAYMTWVNIVPDEPTEEDFKDLASDDSDWQYTVRKFGRILKDYE